MSYTGALLICDSAPGCDTDFEGEASNSFFAVFEDAEERILGFHRGTLGSVYTTPHT